MKYFVNMNNNRSIQDIYVRTYNIPYISKIENVMTRKTNKL